MRLRTWLGLTLAVFAPAAAADPVDLANPEPRWVSVRFEISPPDDPGQTNTLYSQAYPAWLQAGERPGEVQLSIDGAAMERYLRRSRDPVAGSFSDFVWHVDVATGHVRSAGFSGRLHERVGLGLSVKAPMRVRMGTQVSAGYEAARRVLGNRYHRYCMSSSRGCTLVEPKAYDPATGYVNAVGDIRVSSGPIEVRSFSPLGEALFSEVDAPLGERVAGGPPTLPPASAAPPSLN